MTKKVALNDLLDSIVEFFGEKIDPKSNCYSVVDIEEMARENNLSHLANEYRDTRVCVPLKKEAAKGLTVFIGGGEFRNYTQLSSGIFLKDEIAKKAGLSGQQFKPHNQMILYG